MVTKKMQQLLERETYTPTDASPVRSNCDLQLNRDESLSVADLKTSDNNLEVNLRLPVGGLKDITLVYVKSLGGKVLMPCSRTKARRLLEGGRAKIVKSNPLQIQLLFKCDDGVQRVVGSEDTAYKNIGFSAVSGNKELIAGVMVLENGMSDRLLERAMYRRNRRSHKWYREPRFDNRKNMLNKLPPSVERRVNEHVALAVRVSDLVPVSVVNVECGNFDIQKIMNHGIEGVDYQRGSLYEYENVRAFIIAREQGRCQFCGNGYDKGGWHIHHVIPRSKGGTDRPDNLALMHEKCHDKLHKQKLFDRLAKAKQYKAETFMSTARMEIIKRLCKIFGNGNVNECYGYETKIKRKELGLKKSHVNDAFVIAGGTGQIRFFEYVLEQKKRNNRCLQINRKGYKPSIRRQRYSIQPKDLFWVDGKRYVSKGMFSYGKYILYGDVRKREYFKVEEVEKYYSINSWQFIPQLKQVVFLQQKG